MSAIVHYPLYLGVRLVWGLLGLLPTKRAYPLGAAVGRFVFPWIGSRRRVAIENVLAAGIAEDAAGAERIARASLGHFVGHLLESLKVDTFLTPEHLRRQVVTDFPEASRALLEKPGQPLLVLTPHLGCWEIGVHLLTTFKPTMALASPMRNPLAQRFIERHLRQNVEIHSNKKGFSAALVKRWKEGRILALLADQHAGRHGIWLDFLGRLASIHTSPARLYLATRHPMVVGAFVRTGPLRYHAVLSEPLTFALTGDRERDTVTILETINGHFAAYIRRYPEQYLWVHRRWRQKPAVSQRRF
jgi:KDO2-lipid IV(A) lauroyltransferase